MSSPLASSLAFDDVVIDFAGRRLSRAGQIMALEPKAFDVLALLAGAPGQAFTRDQILDAVWGHRHVTPGVLNRIMTLLRHALGEDAQTPRYLHTLHGVGYRFDLPESAIPLPSESSPEDRRGVADRRARSTAEPVQALPGSSRASRRLAPLVGGLVLGSVLLALGWWFRPTAPAPTATRPPSVAASQPTLIVMPLKPIGESASSRDIAAGLSDELITELARISGLRVIARESTDLATAQSRDIVALVPRLNISHALEGSLRQSGEQLRVHVRLTEALSGRTLWAQDYDRKATDVLALQRDIARAVAAALALKLGLSDGPIQKGGDAEFLRRYFSARALLNTSVGAWTDTVERAEAELRVLTRLRPDDGRAHAGLALALEIRAFNRPLLAKDLRLEAGQEAALALRLDPTLGDAYRVQAAAACRSNLWEQCLRQYQTALKLAPSESAPHFQYAMALAALGYLDRAAEIMRESMKRDPLNAAWQFGYARILDTQGHHEQAHALLLLSQPLSPYARWFNAVWRRDFADAQRIAESIGAEEATRDYEQQLRPAYLAASRALRDPSLWPLAEAPMRATEQASGMLNFLRVLAPHPDAPALIAGLDVVRERSYSTWDLLLWTKDLAYLRRDPAFQVYLRDNGILAYWQRHGFPKQCRPLGQGAACD
jgi:TolB-like protein/DNA-binding winged helix-turn-helix (wHTH) protein